MTIYRASHPPPKVELQAVCELREADREQVLSLLAQDPVRSVILRGLILDYGMCAPELRGVFYGYFTDEQLTGVALIGHQLIVFAADDALASFAQKAVEVQARLYMILAPEQQVEKLWAYLSQFGRETRRTSAQRSYVCQQSGPTPERRQLLRANYAELDVVTDAQAEMALEASGIDPRQSDLAGFRHRIVERLERKRIWVKIEEGKVIFKAGDTSATPLIRSIWKASGHTRSIAIAASPRAVWRNSSPTCYATIRRSVCLRMRQSKPPSTCMNRWASILRPLIKRASSLRQCQ